MTKEKAIKIVKEFINGTCLHMVDQEALETLIPELKEESEDEKIRKAIIELLKEMGRDDTGISENVKCMIAYLEKQKESLHISESCKENANSFTDEDERIRKWLFNYVGNCPNENFEFYGGVGKKAVLSWIEKQGEQESKDKSKFKESSEYERIRKAILSGLKYLETELGWDTVGDVDILDAYAWLENHNPSFKQISDSVIWDSGLRTGIELGKKQKEQTLEYLPKEKVYNIMSKLTELSCSKLIPFNSEEYKKIDEITSNVRDLLDYPIEQKSAEWSEEDETRLTNTLIMLKEYAIHHYSKDDVNKSVNWLENRVKSLSPQPKKEWSEDDERRRDGIIQWLRNYQKEFNPEYDSLSIESIESLIAWLKSLQPQAKQEWSKEEQTIIEGACNALEIHGHSKLANKLKSLRPQSHTVSIKDATKFGNLEYERGVKDGIQHAENHRWKPSEEQMEALSETIAFAPDTFKPKCTLVTLQEDLKKLM